MRNIMKLKEKISINGKGEKWYLLAYTMCFAVMAGAIFSVFLLYNKSFVWVPDGLQQHFNALLYYRSWLLQIIHTLWEEHRISIPLWDMSIGMGSDILTTLHYYVIGDPLNLLSVFVPDESGMEGFYSALVIVRLYLAGLAFSVFCKYHGQKPYAMLLGAMVYDFCFWAIVAVRHPYFLNPMIYLPLILLGVDKIYRKEKPWLYIGMLALATISSFYFAYMICIFVAGYALVRYLMIVRKLEIKKILYWISRFLLYSVMALASVCVVLLPVVMMTLSTGRAEAKHDFSLVYPLSYYKKFISGFLMGGAGYWSELGYTGLILIAVIFLLSFRKKYRGLRLGFLVMTLMVLFPYAGLMLNGGSYVINRYMWAYSMLVSFIAVKLYPEMLSMRSKKRIELFWAGITYIFLCLEVSTKSQKPYVAVALLLFAILLLLVIGTSKSTKEKFWFKNVLLVVVMCELVYQGWFKYAPWGDDYVDEFADCGHAYQMLTEDAGGSLVKDAAKDTTYRYESLQVKEWKNTAMQLGLHGVSYYFSLANPYINEFQREMYLNQTRDFCYSGLDGREFLDMLSGVRYFVVPQNGTGYLPYGYDTKLKEGTLGVGTEYEVAAASYENENVLPLGFASDRYIARDDYESMTVTEKQQAILQGIVVDEAEIDTETLQEQTPIFTDIEIPYDVEELDGMEWTDGGVKVTEENAFLKLRFQGVRNCETYFIIEGLDYQGKEGGKKKPKDRLHIQVSCGDVSKKITYLTAKNNFYSGVTDFLVNLGYRRDIPFEVTITFQEKGTYSFDKMRIAAQSMEGAERDKDKLCQEELTDVSLKTNEVTGKIALTQEKLLCMTIPYSTGWTAYVDGKKTKVLRADTMFLAIQVPEGEHDVRLCYQTPYLKVGIYISIAGWCSILFLYGFMKWKERERKQMGGVG